ncbi:Cytochrome c oxidase assembly protein ctaG [Galdieria sulphuraria]|nr:Cytochrome c oxidase assembly protein ctaG [Galdieria sulphuraria]
MRSIVCFSKVGLSYLASIGRIRQKYGTLKQDKYFFSHSSDSERMEKVRAKNKNFLAWAAGITVGVFGLTYGTVPLYRMFCQVTGFGGTTKEDTGGFLGFKTPTQKTKLVPTERPLTIYFTADVNSDLPWTFVPEQREVKVFPGETALAFYRAENKSNEDILGIATYNVQPPKAGIYFNKIQCFCFEEQRLKAKEVIEMPVFFFIDPEFVKDSKMNDVSDISLSYTFFPSEDVSDEMLQKMGWYRDENNQIINKESPAVYPVQAASRPS